MNRTSMILFVMGFALVVLPLFTLNPLQVAILHSDGFENGLADYTVYETAGEVCSTQSNVVYEGSYSAMFTTNASSGNEYAYIMKYVGATYETLSAEMKFRMSGMLTTLTDHISVLSFLGGEGSIGQLQAILTSSGLQWYIRTPLGDTDVSSDTISEDIWYTVKLVGQYARTDGEVALYVNGAKILDIQGDLSNVPGTYKVTVGMLYHWKKSPALTVYVDDLIIQTEATTLTIQSSVGGSTTPTVGEYTYDINSQASVTATADSNYVFDSWLLDGSDVGSANPLLVTMDANHTVKPVFTVVPANSYDLLIHCEPDVNLTYVVGSRYGVTGTPISLTEGTYNIVMPSDISSYTFKQWSDTLSANPQRSVALTANLELTAEYRLVSAPAGQASLEVHAFAGENEVNAVFSIGASNYETTVTGTTVTLTAGTYHVTATWKGQTVTNTVSLASGEVKRLDIQFSVIPIPPPIGALWILPVQILGVGMVGAAIILWKKKAS